MEDKVFASLAKVAKSDIESAILLYNNGNYYNSMSLFQQAVEKGYKASALITKQLTLQDLKKVGHDYMKLLKKVVTDGVMGSNHPIDPLAYKIASDYVELDTDDLHETMEVAKRDEFFHLTEENIELFLSMIEKYVSSIPAMFATAIENKNFVKQVAVYYKLDVEESDLQTSELLSPPEEMQDIYLTINHMLILNIIGLMTSPHSEQARYPSYNTSNLTFFCPSDIYTENMPLVKHQMKLMLLAQESINFLNN